MKRTQRFVIQVMVVGAIGFGGVAACSDDGDDVVPGSDEVVSRLPNSLETPSPSPSNSLEKPSPSPSAGVSEDMEKKLKAAKEAKEEEKADPEHKTVCLKKDGTLAGIIKTDPRPDSPPKTKALKERGCKAAFEGSVWEVEAQ